MKPRKLTRRQFARALRQGRGAAFLHVKEYGDKDKGIKEELLKACLQNLVYDRVCENERSAWLATIIDRTGATSAYAKDLLAALRNSQHKGKDLEQQINLSRHFFERGYFEFAEIVAQLSEAKPLSYNPLEVRCGLFEMFGLPGFARAAELMLDGQDREWGIHDLYKYAADALDSEDSVREYLEAKAATNSTLRVIIKLIDEEKERCSAPHCSVDEIELNLDQVLEKIANEAKPVRYPGYCVRFGRTASEGDLETILNRIETTSDAIKLHCYLAVFWRRTMPRLPENTSVLLNINDNRLHSGLCRALAKSKSPDVVEIALPLLQAGTAKNINTALRLLDKLCSQDIWQGLTARLSKLRTLDQIHDASLSIMSIYWNMDTHVDPGPLLWIFEHTPCSYCRGSAIDKLIEQGQLPATLLFEAQWDCDYETRLMCRAHSAEQTLDCSEKANHHGDSNHV